MELQGYVITLLILIIRTELISAEICEVRKQFKLPTMSSYTLARITSALDGSITVREFKYRSGTFWKADVNEDNKTIIIACPCKMQKCIQHCFSKSILHFLFPYSFQNVRIESLKTCFKPVCCPFAPKKINILSLHTYFL
jgi:hypothetical protein